MTQHTRTRPNPTPTAAQHYEQIKRKARRRPTWWLTRWERRILARKTWDPAGPGPSNLELAELSAVRSVISHRSAARRLGWWVL